VVQCRRVRSVRVEGADVGEKTAMGEESCREDDGDGGEGGGRRRGWHGR
jgi:hypothetical protein